ncbi:MAG: helix-turn-helix domain-containing protein [Dehalococcoidia bacterium]|nr:helix-turn-helix domain-containing protein [Dehalococcoidia bacterium]
MGRREKQVDPSGKPASAMGASLRRARQAKGISLSEMAQRLGYSKSHLSVVETGGVWPSRELLDGYEIALGLRASSLSQMAETLAPLRRSRATTGSTNSAVEAVLGRLHHGLQRDLGAFVAGPATALELVSGTISDLAGSILWLTTLIERAASFPPSSPIVIAVQRTVPLPSDSDLRARWRSALQRALAVGWDVIVVRWPEPHDTDRVALFSEAIEYLGFPGRHITMQINQSPTTLAPFLFAVVPDLGAVQVLPTRVDPAGQYAIYSGLTFTDSESLRVLSGFGQSLRAQATPIISAVERPADWHTLSEPSLSLADYAAVAARNDLLAGDCYTINDRLSSATSLSALLADWRGATPAGPLWSRYLRERRDERLLRETAFREQLRTYRTREILTGRLLAAIVETGVVEASDVAGPLTLTPDERRRWLAALIDLLQTCPNYELAIWHEAPPIVRDLGFKIKDAPERSVLMLEAPFTRDARPYAIMIEATDAIVVTAFREYFLFQWESIPFEHRERQQVIALLRQAMDRLPER